MPFNSTPLHLVPEQVTLILLLFCSLMRVVKIGPFVKCSFFVKIWLGLSVQLSSVAQSCPALCKPMNRSMPGLPVHQQLLEFTQTHVHRVGDAIQPSHPLTFPSPLAINLFQHQGPFKWVSCSHQVAKVLEFQLQHQSFRWTLRTDFL